MVIKPVYPVARAQELIPCPDGTMADPVVGCVNVPASVISPESSLLELILKIAHYAVIAAGVIAVVFLIYGAIRYSTAAGNEERTDRAKQTMFWSIFGLIVSLLAVFVVQFILNIIQ